MIFLAVIGILVLAVGSIILKGWVLSICWGWFITPVFGLPLLTIVQAIGISLVIGYLTVSVKFDDEEKEEDKMKKVAIWLVGSSVFSLLVLFSGYVIHQFM